jgi:hypothetical protein
LVREGELRKLPRDWHTRGTVYSEMLMHVMHEYGSLGDWRELDEDEIEWLYEPLVPMLKESTKPKK